MVVARNHFFHRMEEMPRTALSEFELMVLLAVMRLEKQGYGVPISEEIEIQTGRDVALSSVYAALERLLNKGFATSSMGQPTEERGGRAKQYFQITPEGIQALRNTRTALIKLWSGIPQLEEGRV
jgi:PadR family transcriptional regulator, regulatory protein PadR